jgi:hypothetical protein
MTTSPIRNTRRDTPVGRPPSEAEAEIRGMEEPAVTMDRSTDPPGDRHESTTIRNTTRTTAGGDRGFGTTFAIAAVVLLVAFLIALYFGMSVPDSSTTSNAPPDTQTPVTETVPEATGEAPASDTTTPAAPAQPETTGEAPAPAPSTGTAGTSGSTNP